MKSANDLEKPSVERPETVRNNRETVQSYERSAIEYAAVTIDSRSVTGERALSLLVEALGAEGRVLEIGSGPGWDADFLEANGLSVRRTDITEAFLAFQRERGKTAERLDLIEDELGGPYDGIVALYVLQHIDRTLVEAILGKITSALEPGGTFLVSLREGSGEIREIGTTTSGVYHVALWTRRDFEGLLAAVDLQVDYAADITGDEGDWIMLLARKRLPVT